MPWQETNRMDERCRFVLAYRSGRFTMSQLCASFGVSRPTGYKWVERYAQQGLMGLQERSRAPHHCPHRISDELAQWVLRERRAHPYWGPRKLLARHKRAFPRVRRPSRSAVAQLLRRAGLTQPRRARATRASGAKRVVQVSQPNQLWTIDFKRSSLVLPADAHGSGQSVSAGV